MRTLLIVAALSACATPATAGTEYRDIVIPAITDTASAEAAYTAIEAAAIKVCQTPGRELETYGTSYDRACAKKAVKDTVKTLDNPLLTQIHRERD